jgi:hypothetical protein
MPLAEREDTTNRVDSGKKEDKDLTQLLEWLKQTEESKPEVTYREVSAEDYNFYSGDQDTDEVKLALEDKKRPCTVYNEVKPKIDMLVGMAAQTKHETSVLPVGTEDEPLVELMGGTLKHFQRKIKAKRKELEVFEHTAKSGRSLLYFYIDKSNPFRPVIKSIRIEGRNFWLDPDSQEYDLSDARYLFIDKWLAKEEIEQFWPDFDASQAEQSGRQADGPSFFDEAREKYRIVEGWYYKLVEIIYFINPMNRKVEWLTPQDFSKFVKTLREGIDIGKEEPFVYTEAITSQKSFRKQYYYMIFSGTSKLEGDMSPLRWEGFPAVFCGAYKAYDTNSWFGAITGMKDPQRTLNTNRRQLIYLLQTLPKGILMHEVGAVLNIEEYEERASDPNFHLEVAQGKFEKVKFMQQPSISNIYSLFDDVCIQSMKDVSGAQDSLMGVQTSSREPGITVKARQETGIAVLYVLFDNFRETRFNAGRLLMSLIQQYVTKETVVRIEGEKGIQLLQINSQMNPQVEGFNDISSAEFDYTVSETAETMTIRAATAQMLIDFNHNQPGTIPPDVLLDYVDLPFSAKQRVKTQWEAQQVAQKEAADREYELKLKELDIKSYQAKETKKES